MTNDQRSAVSGQRSFVVGIDAGGTHTRARVANLRGEMPGAGEAGAGNPHIAGTDSARREILIALQRACDNARVERRALVAACLGIAGVARQDERAEWIAWAHEKIAPRVALCNDGEIVIAAGCPDDWGLALIAGTGSSAWGKTREGRSARAGGWGWRFGDEGSGYALACAALRAASQAADGRAEPTRLLDAILADWNLREPTDLIARVYRSGLRNAEIAALASVVIRVADEGDAIARQLIVKAGQELAAALGAVARALHIAPEAIPLALAGGLLLDAPSMRASVLSAARADGLSFQPVTLVREPVRGAVRRALELANRNG
ncbi:MAG: hypothetical protein FJ009_09190 [Chloroflexi bacterium]|nr:hypothetical protein [Chloroflexota bacterium]